MKLWRLAGMAGIVAVLAAGVTLFHAVPAPRIIAYRHDAPGAATIAVAGGPSAAFALSGDAVPDDLNGASVDAAVLASGWTNALPVEHRIFGRTATFRLVFAEGEGTAAGEQSHVVAFFPLGCTWLPAALVTMTRVIGLCGNAGHMEIVRQSPAFLKARYNFEKPDGYSIAGRRSIRLPQADEKKHAEIIDGSDVPMLQVPRLAPEVDGRIGGGRGELKAAARLIAYMNEQPVRIGPVNEAPNAEADAAERLAAIRGGESAVQCQGFRDIWLELAVRMPGVRQVRAVSAYNYFPPFKDLVTFSHALAEIHVADEGRWILVDPWFGFSLRHAGRFLGAEDLIALRGDENAEIEIVPLVVQNRRFVVAGDQTRQPSVSTVAEMAPPLRSRFADGRFQFGYLDYFSSVAYGPEHRRRGPVASRSG